MIMWKCYAFSFWLITLVVLSFVGFLQPAQARSRCDRVEWVQGQVLT